MNQGPRPRALAKAVVAGEIALDEVPEHYRAVVRSHINATILHRANSVACAGSRTARQESLQTTPASIRQEVEEKARQLYQAMKDSRR